MTQLRYHPKMKWRNATSWPPPWAGSYGPGSKFPIGEMGVLKNVEYRQSYGQLPEHLTLDIEYEGGIFSGALCVDDPQLLTRLYPWLRERLGSTIRKIGDME